MGDFHFLLKNIEKFIIYSFIILFYMFQFLQKKYFNFIKERKFGALER